MLSAYLPVSLSIVRLLQQEKYIVGQKRIFTKELVKCMISQHTIVLRFLRDEMQKSIHRTFITIVGKHVPSIL